MVRPCSDSVSAGTLRVDQQRCKVIPHGIYDFRKNEASLHLNTSHDTTELCCETIELWWREQGQFDYPVADELLILCDGGGSNSSSAYIFKEDLQALSNRLGLKLRTTRRTARSITRSSIAYSLT